MSQLRKVIDIAQACEPDFYSISAIPTVAIKACQQEAQTPYCWPPNGSRICYLNHRVDLYWPPGYYKDNHTSHLSILANNVIITRGNRAGSGKTTDLDLGYSTATGNANERSINITIIEHRRFNDSYLDYVHYQGPILILVNGSPSPSTMPATPTAWPNTSPAASSSGTPDKPALKSGQIVSISVGGAIGLIVLAALLYSWCAQCCLALCSPGKAETKRVRAAERRRIRDECAHAQLDVDATRAAVARGEVWHAPVRPGGTWVSGSDWPAAPPTERPVQGGSRGDDEIGAVAGGEGWMEEQRRELQRIEEQSVELQRIEEQRGELQRIEELRREELRVIERREEIARVEGGELPAYEAPPPKYTP
ncbi:uncharacterized protein M421DRAFT_94631 [Didymella exigua CBS 183.55]|uniref:Uncharacterized protein n=1 Tax=Didymella exigua CBS 183.55 TaxID=1150837 RepID=A0A6A5RIW8_9PLEO|nr:uncharacterized protein M421DRAFT_94631 [Didymella exigua CBS 183.55]KAF1925547.1 hypothetical protein M421DRAFT_94631 [Didymella exigua CBS 183.55]